MLDRIRPRLTYSNVMSSLAVFLILGGTAYAQLSRNSVGSRELRPNSVGPKQIKNPGVRAFNITADHIRARHIMPNHVRNRHIAPGAVTTTELADDAVLGPKIADGGVGLSKIAAGAVIGPKIADGAVTASKLGPVTRRSGPATSVAAGGTEQRLANCMAGEQPISGGASWAGFIGITAASQLHVVQSFPTPQGEWVVRVHNGTGSPREFTVHILCLGQ